jgi:hypothetical protein
MVRQYGQSDYSGRDLEACHRVLMEIVNLLKEFSDHMAVVGGKPGTQVSSQWPTSPVWLSYSACSDLPRFRDRFSTALLR